MRQSFAVMGILAFLLRAADSPHVLRGYSTASSSIETQWERKFRDIPQTDRLRENMRRLSARPHHVGSPYDKDNAEWIARQLKSWGLDTHIETFEV
ncbi:MAG: folate hydrolase, partial [Acidobacteriaceae bacterium]|nr:folate hydrolase [Acidobacteriaceae bacterium]